MSERAAELAQLLLREGALRSVDAEHRAVRQELLGDASLYEDVRRRLDAVGFSLVQRMGHIGVMPDEQKSGDTVARNRMGLHAGHARLLVYLWTQLVYREWTDLRHRRVTLPPGTEQAGLFAEEEAPSIGFAHVRTELGELTSAARFKALLQPLQRARFIRYDEKRDRIWADAALYTLIDFARMEDFVVGLARRMGTIDVAGAVRAVATGSRAPDDQPADDEASS